MKTLNCVFHGGSRNFGGSERLPIDGVIKPVLEKTTIFSLPHVCLLSGLTGSDFSGWDTHNWQTAYELAEKQWERSIEKFFADAAGIGVTKATVAALSKNLPSVVIGWSLILPKSEYRGPFPRSICDDLNLTLGVLSRRVADIFIAAREPEFTWETLFKNAFEINEEMKIVTDIKPSLS